MSFNRRNPFGDRRRGNIFQRPEAAEFPGSFRSRAVQQQQQQQQQIHPQPVQAPPLQDKTAVLSMEEGECLDACGGRQVAANDDHLLTEHLPQS